MRRFTTSLIALALSGALTATPAQAEQVAPPKSKGLVLMDQAEYDSLPERDPLMRGRLPEFVDLSSFFPEPGHQGDQGSCVGWAVGYALKTYQEAMEFGIAEPDEFDHFSPAFVFNSIKRGDDCQTGSLISDALDFVANTGAVRMDDFPYQEDQCLPPSEDIKALAKDYSIKNYRRLQKDGMLFAIREALSNDKPVVIAMRVYPSFETWQGGGNYSHNPEIEDQEDYHAVTVVGYSKQRRALKVINSWGTDWGDDGYFWLDYRAAKDLIAEAYVTTDRRRDERYFEDPGIILSELPDDAPASNPSASGTDDISEIRESPIVPPDPVPVAPPVLTASLLANAVTGHVGRTAEGQTPSGYDYYPASVWLNLEEPLLSQIESAEYYFYHSTFLNPMRPVEDTNVFLASWKGYGCIETAEVKVTLTSGEDLSAPFSLCTIWDRFHPGGFRKDGGRVGTQPLDRDAAFEGQFEQEPEDTLPTPPQRAQ